MQNLKIMISNKYFQNNDYINRLLLFLKQKSKIDGSCGYHDTRDYANMMLEVKKADGYK